MDPVTNMRTRTTRIRLNVDNEGGMLRPGMYLTARVESMLGEESKLVIPASAPLITGERAVVYLQDPNAERPTFQGVEVVLGPRVEQGYVVEEGLEEGQRVVTNGAFQIDSALQIIAKRSIMSPGGGIAMTGHEDHAGRPATSDAKDATPSKEAEHGSVSAKQVPGENHVADLPLDELITSYLQIQRALAQDNIEHARHGWMGLRGKSAQLAKLLPEADSLKEKDALRSAFHILSQHVISRAQNHPEEIHRELRLVHCPMAFDFSGADWLQTEDNVRNPYFGAEMLTCGTLKREWPNHD
jgi:Cu(I)/Ag(I) efflux system membrane fusion protein